MLGTLGMRLSPITLLVVPAAMDAREYYGEDGIATNADTSSLFHEQAGYINAVQKEERRKGLPSLLSANLADRGSQDPAYAMKPYNEDGELRFYTNVLDAYGKKRKGAKKEVHVPGARGNSENL